MPETIFKKMVAEFHIPTGVDVPSLNYEITNSDGQRETIKVLIVGKPTEPGPILNCSTRLPVGFNKKNIIIGKLMLKKISHENLSLRTSDGQIKSHNYKGKNTLKFVPDDYLHLELPLGSTIGKEIFFPYENTKGSKAQFWKQIESYCQVCMITKSDDNNLMVMCDASARRSKLKCVVGCHVNCMPEKPKDIASLQWFCHEHSIKKSSSPSSVSNESKTYLNYPTQATILQIVLNRNQFKTALKQNADLLKLKVLNSNIVDAGQGLFTQTKLQSNSIVAYMFGFIISKTRYDGLIDGSIEAEDYDEAEFLEDYHNGICRSIDLSPSMSDETDEYIMLVSRQCPAGYINDPRNDRKRIPANCKVHYPNKVTFNGNLIPFDSFPIITTTSVPAKSELYFTYNSYDPSVKQVTKPIYTPLKELKVHHVENNVMFSGTPEDEIKSNFRRFVDNFNPISQSQNNKSHRIVKQLSDCLSQCSQPTVQFSKLQHSRIKEVIDITEDEEIHSIVEDNTVHNTDNNTSISEDKLNNTITRIATIEDTQMGINDTEPVSIDIKSITAVPIIVPMEVDESIPPNEQTIPMDIQIESQESHDSSHHMEELLHDDDQNLRISDDICDDESDDESDDDENYDPDWIDRPSDSSTLNTKRIQISIEKEEEIEEPENNNAETSKSMILRIRSPKQTINLPHYKPNILSFAEIEYIKTKAKEMIQKKLSDKTVDEIVNSRSGALYQKNLPNDYAEVQACCYSPDVRPYLPQNHPFSTFEKFVEHRVNIYTGSGGDGVRRSMLYYMKNRSPDPADSHILKDSEKTHRVVMIDGHRCCESCFRALIGRSRATMFRFKSYNEIGNIVVMDLRKTSQKTNVSITVIDRVLEALLDLINTLGDPVPNNTNDKYTYIEVPFRLRHDLCDHLTIQLKKTVSRSTLSRALERLRDEQKIFISLAKVKRFMKCTICKILQNNKQAAKPEAEREAAQIAKQTHFKQVSDQREFYHKLRDQAK